MTRFGKHLQTLTSDQKESLENKGKAINTHRAISKDEMTPGQIKQHELKELQLIEEYKNNFSQILQGVEGTVLHNKGAMGQVAFDSIFGILNEVPGLNEVTALLDTLEHLGLDASRFNIDPDLEDGGLDLAKNIMSALHDGGDISPELKEKLIAHHEQTGHKMTDDQINNKLSELKKLIENIKQKKQVAAPKAAAPKAVAPKAAAPKAAPAAPAAGGNKKKRKKSRKYKKRKNKITRKRRYKPKKKNTKKTIRKAKKSRKRKH